MQTASINATDHAPLAQRRPLLCTLANDERLRTTAAAAALAEYIGAPVSPKTLANHRSHGTGPRFTTWGQFILYAVGDLRAWADEKMGQPVRSTAERSARG